MPFSATMDLVIAGFSVVLFAAFILYDTQQIMKRLSVDEVILGTCLLVRLASVCLTGFERKEDGKGGRGKGPKEKGRCLGKNASLRAQNS